MAGEEVAAEENAAAEDGNAELEEDEGERGADGDGLGNALPAARVKRIMRKNPDKKKNFSKECVLAVSMATVSSRPRSRPHLRSALNPGIPGMAPRAPRACAAPPEPGRPCCAPAAPSRLLSQELFLNDIVVKSHENTLAKRRKTMQLQDIGACLAIGPPVRPGARACTRQLSGIQSIPPSVNTLGPGFVAWCPSLVAALASCLVCLWCLVGLVGSSVVSFLVRAAAVPFRLLIKSSKLPRAQHGASKTRHDMNSWTALAFCRWITIRNQLRVSLDK
jgi:histone H3/H4